MKTLAPWIACFTLIAITHASAADLGRMAIQPRPATIIRQPIDEIPETRFAIEGRLEFNSYSWDLGDDSFRHLAVAPQIVGSHSITDQIELRLGLMVAHLSDDDIDTGDGIMMDPSLTLVRPGIGARFWGNRQTLFPFYADIQINYFLLSGDDVSIQSSPASLSGGAGICYAFEEGIELLVGLTLETSFKDGKTRFNGVDRDLSLHSIGFGLGLRYMF